MEDNAYQYYSDLCGGIRMLSAQHMQIHQAIQNLSATIVPGKPVTSDDMEQVNQKLSVLNENMNYLNKKMDSLLTIPAESPKPSKSHYK